VAKVFSVPESRTIQAIVDEDQLSLAIGRAGQNVRLASELTGWKIDLYSSREWLERGGEGPLFAPIPTEAEEEQVTRVALTELKGLPAEVVGVLGAAGIVELSDLLDLDSEELRHVPGLSPEQLEVLQTFIADLTEESGEPSRAEGDAAATPEPEDASGT
jgi:N utilization substance protein A